MMMLMLLWFTMLLKCTWLFGMCVCVMVTTCIVVVVDYVSCGVVVADAECVV